MDNLDPNKQQATPDNGGVTAPLQDPKPAEDVAKTDQLALDALAKQEQDIKDATGANTPDSERPDWLPEKFKTPEDLAKSYAELEKKLGSSNKPEPKPEPKPEQEQSVIDKYTQKYMENNQSLTDDDYAELKKAGYDKNIVDTYIQGKQYEAQQYEQNVLKDIVPDKSAYDEMLKWGTENYSDSEMSAYNAMVNSGNVTQARMAVEHLKGRYTAQNPQQDSTTLTGTAGGSVGAFQSWQQVTEAMSDPKYKTDHAYRQQVQSKLNASANLG